MTGLSILIPVYNRDVRPLVEELLRQAPSWPEPLEIICLDDLSREAYRQLNRPLARQPLVRYEELPANLGRAAIRNQLAARAQHEWLLLLDNDSLIPSPYFLLNYYKARRQAPVLVGGTCYERTPPADEALLLRYYYGVAREARSAERRQQQPYAQLTLNNLLIQAAVFRRFGLDEELTRYGHEDTKFGWRLQEAGVPVQHLKNPVLHDGLEPAPVFLEKSHEAVRNLALIYRNEGLGADTRLLALALRLRKLGLAGAARQGLSRLAPALRRQVLSAAPSLRAFDLLRLGWLLDELARPVGAPAEAWSEQSALARGAQPS